MIRYEKPNRKCPLTPKKVQRSPESGEAGRFFRVQNHRLTPAANMRYIDRHFKHTSETKTKNPKLQLQNSGRTEEHLMMPSTEHSLPSHHPADDVMTSMRLLKKPYPNKQVRVHTLSQALHLHCCAGTPNPFRSCFPASRSPRPLAPHLCGRLRKWHDGCFG